MLFLGLVNLAIAAALGIFIMPNRGRDVKLLGSVYCCMFFLMSAIYMANHDRGIQHEEVMATLVELQEAVRD